MIRPVSSGVFATLGYLVLMTNLVGSVEIASSSSLGDDGTNVYHVLPKYGFPAGLLPDGVKNFSLSESDGRFVVDLERPCYVQMECLVFYDTTITGTLRYGSITGLKGIQVRRFFIWLDVNEIKVDLPPSDSIYFQIGLVSKRLDAAEFSKPRSCRDDFRWWDSLYFEVRCIGNGVQTIFTCKMGERKMGGSTRSLVLYASVRSTYTADRTVGSIILASNASHSSFSNYHIIIPIQKHTLGARKIVSGGRVRESFRQSECSNDYLSWVT